MYTRETNLVVVFLWQVATSVEPNQACPAKGTLIEPSKIKSSTKFSRRASGSSGSSCVFKSFSGESSISDFVNQAPHVVESQLTELRACHNHLCFSF